MSVKLSLPIIIDKDEYPSLRAAVAGKHPKGLAGYATVYARVSAGWPVVHAILLPPRAKEG